MPRHGIDAVIRDRGDERLPADVRQLPSYPGTSEPSTRAADHNEVDTPPRDDVRVEPPAMGGRARKREDDSLPLQVDGPLQSVDVTADLEGVGILAGILNLFA